MPGESTDRDVESLSARLALALEAGAVAEWSIRPGTGEWLLATRLDTIFGPGMPIDAEAANADARQHDSDATANAFPLTRGSFAGRLEEVGTAALGRAWRELTDAGGQMRVEARILRTDGEPRVIRVDGVLSNIDGAGSPRASGFVRDITEQRRLGEINGFLQRLSLPLAGIGSVEDTLQRLASDVVPFLADRCVIDFVTFDGSLLRAADSHVPPREASPLPSSHPASRVPDAPLIERIISERRTLALTDLDESEIRDLSVTEEQRAELEAYRPCDYLGAPLVAHGRCFGVLGILTRLDEKRRFLEHEIGLVDRVAERLSAALDNARLYASLKASEKHKDLFLATLSHELRNPVGAIANGIEALRGSVTSPDDHDVLAAIDRQMNSLSHMLDDLLDVARINAGKLDLIFAPVSLATLFGDISRALAPTFEERDQDFRLKQPSPDIVLQADRTRLEQVLVNLLINASHYTPSGGDVSLGALRIDEGPDRAACVCIEVSDSGVGLDAMQRERVFDHFVQFREEGEPSAGGLGLGLGVVRRLVGLHDGSIDVESEGRGHGCTFRVTLPIAGAVSSLDDDGRAGSRTDVRSPTEALANAPAPGRPDAGVDDLNEDRTRNPRAEEGGVADILLVEDNVDAATSLERVLTRFGHRVRMVHDGASAVAAFEQSPATLVLLDLGLPDVDGFAVAGNLRRCPGGEACTLIALTGRGLEGDRDRTLAAGFDDHLVKPLKLAVLRDIASRVAARSKDAG